MNLRDWLAERQQNAEHLAKLRPQDGAGWLEDADYFRRAVEAVDELARMKRAAHGVSLPRQEVSGQNHQGVDASGFGEGADG